MKSLAQVVSILARYVAWIALSGLWLWALLQVRINVIDIAIWIGASRWALPAIDKFATVPLILLWLGLAIWLEGHLTSPVDTPVFVQRAARVGGVLLVVLGISYVLQFIVR
jgi:hypothetical protein